MKRFLPALAATALCGIACAFAFPDQLDDAAAFVRSRLLGLEARATVLESAAASTSAQLADHEARLVLLEELAVPDEPVSEMEPEPEPPALWPDGMAEEYRPAPPLAPDGETVTVTIGGDIALQSNRIYVLAVDVGRITVAAGTSRVRVLGGGHSATTIELPQQWASPNPATSEPRCSDLYFEDLTLTGTTNAAVATIRGDGERLRFERVTASTPASNGLVLYSWGSRDVAVVDCHFDGGQSHAQRLVNVTKFASWGGSRRSATHFALRVHGTGGTSSYVWVSDMELVGPVFAGYPAGGSNPQESINHLELRRLKIQAHGTGNCLQFAPPSGLQHFTVRDCTLKGASAVAQLAQLNAVQDPTWVRDGNVASAN